LIAIISPVGHIAAKDNLDIKSDTLKYDRHKNIATFEGNVLICLDGIRIHTDKVIFHFLNKSKIKEVRIPSKIKAIREKDNSVILADKGIYILKNEMLKLIGNVVIEDNKGIVITNEMVYQGKLKNIILDGKEAS
jgi:lipopolysaccharide transport protein LptA